ncbi:transcriptional regulator [Marinicauda salina]|uniref:Transcriptional regulator n=1 Tax=Marinicauda salina TaxID=2135793 RepID=A0A2U2BY21_9PROT|nr:metal-sensitive transcriptional regulator [Marinicauda salina]PWE18900.1 transcriptional regulator [Marinicauda salina]
MGIATEQDAPHETAKHKATLDRLKRIEGQVRGVSAMVAEDRYCIDILTQLSAIKSALASVEREVLKNHARHCLESAIASGDPADQREKFEELVALLSKHYKL